MEIKYKVTATIGQLFDIGCEELFEQEVEYVKTFPDSWIEVKFYNKELSELFGKPHYNNYDILPKYLIKL